MAPQSQLEESANDRGVHVLQDLAKVSETSPLRRCHCSQTPLFDVGFLENAFKIASRWPKRCLQKIWTSRSITITEFGGFEAVPGSPFGHFRRSYCSQKPPNQGPETDPRNLLKKALIFILAKCRFLEMEIHAFSK